ncbi:hypothetical protein P43SY_009940 [Pythium insidiosum]|uniref:Ankyrin repeat protein n=1 Tax=Pythium insidiosum TaxID=114742 RepID=A0AAD5LH06_PYTIN|nr:hypothetical protein P43SY_009940 [Pythium insidiosum]
MKIGKKESELAKAVERGDVRRAQTLLDKGAVTVDARDWPMLYRAAWYGSIDIARLLLQRGADIESRNENGMTALNAAARCGHGDIVGLLIDHGADIEAKDKNGLTALCVASSGGHIDIVRRLLARGADLGSKSNNGDAALHFTASRGWITVASLLLQHGADVETRNENGETALHCAASSGQIEVVRLLLEHHVNIVAEDNRGDAALHYAASHGHTGVVRLLLGYGADTEAKNELEKTAFGVLFEDSKLDHEREQGRELMEIPEEVFNQGANAVNTYITALTESSSSVYRHKICVVGPTTWGKSSLILHWLQLILSRLPDAEILFVGTKVDCLQREDVAAEIQADLLERLHFGLAYPADNERMTTTSSLIVPAYWKMRLDDDEQVSQRDWSDLALGQMGLEATQQVHRYEWEYRFEFQCLPTEDRAPSGGDIKASGSPFCDQFNSAKVNGTAIALGGNATWTWLLAHVAERVLSLALVEALVQQLPAPVNFGSYPDYKFTVVARRSPREPIEVDCRAIRLALRFTVSWNYERILQHIHELMDLLSWLAACPGCTVPENPFLWQQIVQLLVGDTISCETIVFGDAAAFPRWIMSFKAQFGDERQSDVVSRPETFDRDHSFVQSLFSRPLVDADTSEPYAQAMLHVRPLVEQPLEIPIGIDLDCSSQPSRIRFHEQIRAFVKGLRANAVPNRIKFDSFGWMDDRFRSIEQMDETHDMELMIRETSDVWVPRFQTQVPPLDYDGYGSDNEDVLLIECVRHEYGMNSMFTAARNGDLRTVDALLDNGVGADARDARTPLFGATSGGHGDVVRLLLERGADVDARDKEGRSVLSWAALSSDASVVRLLLERGASVDAKDKDGRTALHWAAGWSKIDVVRLLRERDADVEAKDTDGRTALHHAANRSQTDAVRELLELGADIDATDNDGRTALYQAAERNHTDVLQLLLERGADVNAQDKDGRTALFCAARWSHAKVARLLLERDIDIEVKDKVD